MENDRMVNSRRRQAYIRRISQMAMAIHPPTVPIQGYEGFIRPADDARAKALGDAWRAGNRGQDPCGF